MSDTDKREVIVGMPRRVRLETDPVCGMKVDPERAGGGSHAHGGKVYWFCNPRCRERFASDPEHWLKAGPRASAMAAPAASDPELRGSPIHSGRASGGVRGVRRSTPSIEELEWVCPMDPEVLEKKPGPCPICGMALEPRTLSAAPQVNPELVDMRRRLVV